MQSSPNGCSSSTPCTIVAVVAVALANSFVSAAFAANGDVSEKLRLRAVNAVQYALPIDGLTSSTNGVSATGLYIGATSGNSSIGCTPGQQDATRGLTIGCTFYDFQRNGSMNRMIATNEPTHALNFTWMSQDNNSATQGRSIRYEGFDPAFGSLSDGTGGFEVFGTLIPCGERPGFPALDSRANGTTVLTFEINNCIGAPLQPWVLYNANPSIGDFAGLLIDTTVYDSFKEGNTTEFKWPRVAYTNDGAGAEVTHVLLNSNRTDADGRVIYTRKLGIGAVGVWKAPIEVGAGGFHLSSAITSSRKAGSQKVVIAAALGRGDGAQLGGYVRRFDGQVSGQYDNDIFYMESSDAGATWGALTNVTMRADSLAGGFAPGAKLDVLYDDADVFHIVWQAMAWKGYSGDFTTQGRLFHYDPSSDTTTIVHDFVWNQTMCNGGLFNLNATNPQISECNGKLYVTFEQFNDIPAGIEDDCSERAPSSPEGAANGDIYVTVSDDGGRIWDTKRNLTLTYTPDCDTIPGGIKPDCDSDVWHSTTRYGIDIEVNSDDFNAIADLSDNVGGYAGPNYLFVQYINDADPGGAINAEGTWTNNGVKVFRFGCIEALSGARLASSLPQSEILNADTLDLTERDSTLNWVLQNIGNIDINDLSVTLSNVNPAGQITMTAFGSTLLAGGANSETGVIRLNAPMDSIVASASATIVVAGTFAHSPRVYTLNYSIVASCCIVAGDFNSDGDFNVADVTAGIARIFESGPAPVCQDQADANGDNTYNIADVTYGINRIFGGGPAPVCGTTSS
jgi:hypothetical protein